MTVTVTTVIQSYTGDGATTAFPTVFVFGTSADIEVIERNIATGVETTKTLTTDYSVSGGGGAGSEPATGTVTAVTAPASTVKWILRRIVATTQGTSLPTSGALPTEAIEGMVDRVVMNAQQTAEESGRGLVFPKTDSSSLDPEIPNSVDRASKFLAFDSAGNPIASTGPTGDSSIPVSPFVETLLDDATAAAFRTTLGAVGTGDANTFSKTQTLTKGADLASATSLALGTDGNYFDVTGNTTVETITGLAGTEFTIQTDSTLTFRDSATLDLGGINISALAGSRLKFFMLTDTLAQIQSFHIEGFAFHRTASQGEMETPYTTFVAVSPGALKWHPGVAKFWCDFQGDSAGPITPRVDYNVTDVTDTATGRYTVNIATDFSGADFAVVGMGQRRTAYNYGTHIEYEAGAASSPRAAGTVAIASAVNSVLEDSEYISVVGFGDQ